MSKVGIVILTDTEGDEALGRVVNALSAAQEFKQAGDKVQVIFTGAGTKWLGKLAQEEHALHAPFDQVRDCVAGACRYCAEAFDAADAATAAGVCLLSDYGPNMSFRALVSEGYQVLMF